MGHVVGAHADQRDIDTEGQRLVDLIGQVPGVGSADGDDIEAGGKAGGLQPLEENKPRRVLGSVRAEADPARVAEHDQAHRAGRRIPLDTPRDAAGQTCPADSSDISRRARFARSRSTSGAATPTAPGTTVATTRPTHRARPAATGAIIPGRLQLSPLPAAQPARHPRADTCSPPRKIDHTTRALQSLARRRGTSLRLLAPGLQALEGDAVTARRRVAVTSTP